MANTKSAKKSIKVNRRNTIANKAYKTRIKTTEKKFLQKHNEFLLDPTDDAKTILQELLNLYYKRIDLAVKKNLLHQNKAARKKSQMAKKLTK